MHSRPCRYAAENIAERNYSIACHKVSQKRGTQYESKSDRSVCRSVAGCRWGRSFPKKAPSPWTITVDEKLKPFPAGAQLLTLLLVAEPSKAEAAIQISMEGTLSPGWRAGRSGHRPTQFQPEHAQTVRAVLAEACGNAAGSAGRNAGQVATHQGRKLDSGQTGSH